MNRNAAAAILIIALVACLSAPLATQTPTVYPPYVGHLTPQQVALSIPLVIGVTAQTHPLDQQSRAEIYQYVQDTPGVHFRGICEALSLSVGMVQYHVGVLVAAGFLSVYGDGKMQRFFVSGKYEQKQMKIITLLRHANRGKILRILHRKKAASHGELTSELQITSQGLTWQMHKLQKEGIIATTNNGLKLTYQISQTYTQTLNQTISLIDPP